MEGAKCVGLERILRELRNPPFLYDGCCSERVATAAKQAVKQNKVGSWNPPGMLVLIAYGDHTDHAPEGGKVPASSDPPGEKTFLRTK